MWNVSLNLCIGAKRRKGTREKHACSSTQFIEIQKIRNSLIIIIIIYINLLYRHECFTGKYTTR